MCLFDSEPKTKTIFLCQSLCLHLKLKFHFCLFKQKDCKENKRIKCKKKSDFHDFQFSTHSNFNTEMLNEMKTIRKRLKDWRKQQTKKTLEKVCSVLCSLIQKLFLSFVCRIYLANRRQTMHALRSVVAFCGDMLAFNSGHRFFSKSA